MRSITIGSLHDQRPIAVRAERLPGRRHRCCVTIQPDDPPIRPTRFKDGHAVSSRPSRPVEIDPTSPWLQPSQHRSEEHTSELQSRLHLVCRLLLEKKKNKT